MNRRGFLKIAFAAGVATAIPTVLAEVLNSVPLILGDGVHDDTLGLQAALNGEEFACPANLVQMINGVVQIRQGYFRVTAQLNVSSKAMIDCANCTIKAEHTDRTVLNFKPDAQYNSFRDMTVIGSGNNSAFFIETPNKVELT